MGFSSMDDFVSEVSEEGKFWRADFCRNYIGTVTAAIGRWYDLAFGAGVPVYYQHGNMVINGHCYGGEYPWVLGSSFWVYTPATHLITRSASGDGSTVSQNTRCVRDQYYMVIYTVARTAGGVTASLGGTSGTQRVLAGTYYEQIKCGSTAGAPLVFTPDAAFAGSIDAIVLQQPYNFMPYNDQLDIALWHGGNVSPDTKHLVNYGAWTNVAVGAPSVLMLVDMLGTYPHISTNSALEWKFTHNNMIYNGGFTGLDGWISGGTGDTFWSSNGSVAYKKPGSTIGLSSQTNIPAYKDCPYYLTYTLSNSWDCSGSVTPYLGLQSGTAISSNQTITEVITPQITSGLIFKPDTNFSGSIDNVSLTPIVPRCDISGAGVRAYYVLDNGNGATATYWLMKYTNPKNEVNRPLGATVANTASAIVGHIEHTGVAAGNYGPFLPLYEGDTGIKCINSGQWTAAAATANGSNCVVLCKPIASLPITTLGVAAERDLMNQLPSLPQIRDGACLGFLLFAGAATTTATQYQGYCDFAWG